MRFAVSVVVPTCRRPELLGRCLEALVAQDLAAPYEIIVVDDGADEETREVVSHWSRGLDVSPVPFATREATGERVDASETGHLPGVWRGGQLPQSVALAEVVDNRPITPRIRYIPLAEQSGPAAARNVGWRAAQSAIIAFTDDDCVPTPGWLRTGLAAFGENAVGVSGRIVVPLPSQPADYERNASFLERSEFVTANCFYLRSMLASVGGFDERFTAAWREDSDLFFSLLEYAERTSVPCHFVRAPDAIVIHPLRRAPWGISLQQQRKNVFNALLYKKHPRLYRQRLGAGAPWHYYAIVSMLLIAVLIALAGFWNVAIGAGAIWAGMTTEFCVERLKHTSHHPKHVAEMALTSALIPPVALFWRAYGALKFRVWFV